MIVETVATFGVIAFTLTVAHNLSDHVLGQTDYHATNKTKPGKEGWVANILHVLDYHVILVIMLATVIMLFNLPVTFLGVFLGLLFSAVTHAFLDRRWPVKWLLEHTGSPEFAKIQTPIWGIYQADQALHEFCLWIAAIIITLI